MPATIGSAPATQIAYTELYVSGASLPTILRRYTHGFGFDVIAEAAAPGRQSLLLSTGQAPPLIISVPTSSTAMADHLYRHGDCIADVALYRTDLPEIVARADECGLPILQTPRRIQTGHTIAQIGGPGMRHTLIDAATPPPIPPDFRWRPATAAHDLTRPDQTGPLTAIDHLAVGLPTGELPTTAARYRHTLGMHTVEPEAPGTTGHDNATSGDTGQTSIVLRGPGPDGEPGLTLVLAEPDATSEPGQIDRFLQIHQGPGVQHLAWHTDDILTTTQQMAARGIEFLHTPMSYYAGLVSELIGHPAAARCPTLHTALLSIVQQLTGTGVLLDLDDQGRPLQQIFTNPLHEDCEIFDELIQRVPPPRPERTFPAGRHQGLGDGNVRRLSGATPAAPTGHPTPAA